MRGVGEHASNERRGVKHACNEVGGMHAGSWGTCMRRIGGHVYGEVGNMIASFAHHRYGHGDLGTLFYLSAWAAGCPGVFIAQETSWPVSR